VEPNLTDSGKNSAFVEFANVAAFNAAVAANPHKVGNENIYVEERRPAANFASQRGSARGGRGGAANFEGRSNQGRNFNGAKTEGAPRAGGFNNREGRGRGGNTTTTNNNRSGARAQAA
jgi:hypothetical protein